MRSRPIRCKNVSKLIEYVINTLTANNACQRGTSDKRGVKATIYCRDYSFPFNIKVNKFTPAPFWGPRWKLFQFRFFTPTADIRCTIYYQCLADELKDIDCEPTFYVTTHDRIEDVDYATSLPMSANVVTVRRLFIVVWEPGASRTLVYYMPV